MIQDNRVEYLNETVHEVYKGGHDSEVVGGVVFTLWTVA